RLVSQFRDVPNYQSEMGAALNNLALVLQARGDNLQARALLEQAIGCQKIAVRLNPRRPQYRRFLRNHLRALTETMIRLGEHTEAARAAEEMRGVCPETAAGHYYAARYLIRCGPLAERDANLSVTQRGAAVQAYVTRGKAMLREAAQRCDGNTDAQHRLVWRLANSADARFRDPGLAVSIAQG